MWESEIPNYFNESLLEDQFTAAMKAQERIAILGIINAKKLEILAEGQNLEKTLNQKASDMHDFSSNRLVSRLNEGLEGKGADAANDYLKHTLKQPNFKNPIKKG